MSTPTSVIQPDKFWFKDIGVLFRSDRLTEFIPVNEQSLEERMNSIARFGLYISIIMMVYKRNPYLSIVFPLVLTATYVIYYNYTKPVVEKITDVESSKDTTIPKPTLNNPFMNTLMTDYVDNPGKKSAPSYFEDTDIAQKIRDDVNTKFRHDLYMGIDDVYEKNNSQRQFYTTPNTSIPSDQDTYLKFMYPGMTSCKSDTKDCKINEDLRGRPYIFPDQTENPIVL